MLMAGVLNRFVLRPYWRLTRAMTLGVRGLVRDKDGRVLLVRHSYAPGWHLPGGGVERGETLLEALTRELAEEGGVAPAEPPQLHGVFANLRFPGDHVAVYVIGRWRAVPSDHGREIVAAEFHAPGTLPADTAEGTRRRIAEICDGAPVSDIWSERA